MKLESSQMSLDGEIYSASKVNVDDLKVIEESMTIDGKEVYSIKQSIVDKTLEICDDGSLIDNYKDICDFNTNSENANEGSKFNKIFGKNTPEIISSISKEISANNMTSAEVEKKYGWKLGDTISYQLNTGENIEMRIIGFNHDALSDGSGKAGITLEMTHCLKTRYPMGGSLDVYDMSTMHTTTLPTLKQSLSEEWQNYVQHVNKSVGFRGSYIRTFDTDLFLLTYTELTSSSGNSSFNERNVCTQYEYYKKLGVTDSSNRDLIVKKYDTDNDGVPDTNIQYNLRSSYSSSSSYYFTKVNVDGANNWIQTDNTTLFGVSFAFCI